MLFRYLWVMGSGLEGSLEHHPARKRKFNPAHVFHSSCHPHVLCIVRTTGSSSHSTSIAKSPGFNPVVCVGQWDTGIYILKGFTRYSPWGLLIPLQPS